MCQASLALPWSEKVMFDFGVQTRAKTTVRVNNPPEGARVVVSLGLKNDHSVTLHWCL